MKKITFCTLLCALFTFGSCDMFSVDNYDEPAETLQGEVVDVATGEKVLTDQGSEGIRVRLTELSWGDNVQHNPDYYYARWHIPAYKIIQRHIQYPY